MKPKSRCDGCARIIVEIVLNNLAGRSGFDAWWYELKPDIQEEMRLTLAELVSDYLENVKQ